MNVVPRAHFRPPLLCEERVNSASGNHQSGSRHSSRPPSGAREGSSSSRRASRPSSSRSTASAKPAPVAVDEEATALLGSVAANGVRASASAFLFFFFFFFFLCFLAFPTDTPHFPDSRPTATLVAGNFEARATIGKGAGQGRRRSRGGRILRGLLQQASHSPHAQRWAVGQLTLSPAAPCLQRATFPRPLLPL